MNESFTFVAAVVPYPQHTGPEFIPVVAVAPALPETLKSVLITA